MIKYLYVHNSNYWEIMFNIFLRKGNVFYMETPENQFKSKLNPWFSIWIKPRDTMKEIFISNPKNVFLLILLGTFVQALDRASFKKYGGFNK